MPRLKYTDDWKRVPGNFIVTYRVKDTLRAEGHFERAPAWEAFMRMGGSPVFQSVAFHTVPDRPRKYGTVR